MTTVGEEGSEMRWIGWVGKGGEEEEGVVEVDDGDEEGRGWNFVHRVSTSEALYTPGFPTVRCA